MAKGWKGSFLGETKGPGLYSDIGKKARDLLYKDLQGNHIFAISTYTSLISANNSSGIKIDDLFSADVSSQLKNKNITTDVKADTSSNLFTSITIHEPDSGLKTVFSFNAPDQRSDKMELQYQDGYIGISTSIGLTANPIVNFSGVVGNDSIALGTDISFDTASANFTKFNAGLSYNHGDLTTALTLNDNGDSLTASYYHTPSFSLYRNIAVGAELTHSFSSNKNTLSIGTQHSLNALTSVKARVNSFGKASYSFQREWRHKSLFIVSGEVDTRAIEKRVKFGLALALKP